MVASAAEIKLSEIFLTRLMRFLMGSRKKAPPGMGVLWIF